MKLSGAELKSKAPAGWRTPRRFANFGGSTSRRQLLECGSLLPLSHPPRRHFSGAS